MRRHRGILTRVVLAFGLSVGALPAIAQTQPRPGTASPAQPPVQTAPAVPTEPQSTTAAFGDWVVRCVRQVEPPLRVCEAVQTIQAQGQQGPLAQIAFGRLQRGDPMRLTGALPVNIALPSAVRVLADAQDAQPAELAWRRCVPGACIADLELTPAVLQKLRARTESGQIIMRDASGRDIVLPLSFRGLAQALDALAREQG